MKKVRITSTVSVPETEYELKRILRRRTTKTQHIGIYREFLKGNLKVSRQVFLSWILEAQDELFDEVPVTEDYGMKTSDGFHPYHYIPLHTDIFAEFLLNALKKVPQKRISFVDAGSGTGEKLLILELILKAQTAKLLGKTCGVELRKELVQNRIHPGVEYGDITKFDYSPFNLIYAYNPMEDSEGMFAFFMQVLKTAPIGAVCCFANVLSGEKALFDAMDKTKKEGGKTFIEIPSGFIDSRTGCYRIAEN